MSCSTSCSACCLSTRELCCGSVLDTTAFITGKDLFIDQSRGKDYVYRLSWHAIVYFVSSSILLVSSSISFWFQYVWATIKLELLDCPYSGPQGNQLLYFVVKNSKSQPLVYKQATVTDDCTDPSKYELVLVKRINNSKQKIKLIHAIFFFGKLQGGFKYFPDTLYCQKYSLTHPNN